MTVTLMALDRVLTRITAQVLQNEPRDRMLFWAVYVRPADFPDRVIIRPHIGDEGFAPLPCRIEAPTLEEALDMLPRAATCIGRVKNCDPSILEVWICSSRQR